MGSDKSASETPATEKNSETLGMKDILLKNPAAEGAIKKAADTITHYMVLPEEEQEDGTKKANPYFNYISYLLVGVAGLLGEKLIDSASDVSLKALFSMSAAQPEVPVISQEKMDELKKNLELVASKLQLSQLRKKKNTKESKADKGGKETKEENEESEQMEAYIAPATDAALFIRKLKLPLSKDNIEAVNFFLQKEKKVNEILDLEPGTLTVIQDAVSERILIQLYENRDLYHNQLLAAFSLMAKEIKAYAQMTGVWTSLLHRNRVENTKQLKKLWNEMKFDSDSLLEVLYVLENEMTKAIKKFAGTHATELLQQFQDRINGIIQALEGDLDLVRSVLAGTMLNCNLNQELQGYIKAINEPLTDQSLSSLTSKKLGNRPKNKRIGNSSVLFPSPSGEKEYKDPGSNLVPTIEDKRDKVDSPKII